MWVLPGPSSVNAVLAFIEGAEPKNEVEAALAIQMACTHAVTMAVLSHLGGAFGASRNTAMMVAAVAKLGRAFAAQVEALAQAEKRWIAVRSRRTRSRQ